MQMLRSSKRLLFSKYMLTSDHYEPMLSIYADFVCAILHMVSVNFLFELSVS